MNPTSSIESRIAALISAYADRAPTDVDPLAMTRLAAASAHRWAWTLPRATHRRLAWVLLAVALLVSMVAGALIAGGPRERDPEDILVQRGFIEPFIGLPPEGAPPSAPETGALVFTFSGRVAAIGHDAHLMWLYADGRLIWKRNLDNTTDQGRLAFGASEPTKAVIEQRLTPDGVELLRTAVTAGGRAGVTGGPGLCCWGALLYHDGVQLVRRSWSDPTLPGRLATPGSWLPPSAWADQRIGGYVPRQYAVCADPPNGLARVPATVRDLILANAHAPARSAGTGSDCHLVPTAIAHEIAATLEASGIRLDEVSSGVVSFDRRVFVYPVTPDGEPICVSCG